jgi:uncharacterized membrane protein
MTEILKMIAITFIPTLELRASIPYGIFATKFHWTQVFIICVAANIVLGWLVFLFLDIIIKTLLHIKPIARLWSRYVKRTQQKIEKGVQKYGEWAVIIFIGIPLPGSGVYTGALASYLIGIRFKKFIIADILGVLIAAVLVTIVCLTGTGLANVFIKVVH